MSFTKGQPKPPNSGKRKGSVNKGTERARRLIAEGDDKIIIDKIVTDAKNGDAEGATALCPQFAASPAASRDLHRAD
jgi:hypothetical protein